MIEEKIKELTGIDFPPPPKPLAMYVYAQQSGNLVYSSGQLPFLNGQLIATGKVGAEVSEEKGKECAQLCAINCLSAIKTVIGDLSKIEKIVKLVVFVSSADGFYAQPQVANGASELMVKLFGDAGKHARSAMGARELPINAPVEVEMIVQVK